MIKLLAETPRDQKIVDALKKAGKWKDKKLEEKKKKIEELEKELEEYRKRHPASVGVKNGKPYVITAVENEPHKDVDASTANREEKRKPGAQEKHKGHYRIRRKITERINVHSNASFRNSFLLYAVSIILIYGFEKLNSPFNILFPSIFGLKMQYEYRRPPS